MSETSTEPPVCFVDTNIWFYAFISGQDNSKFDRARQSEDMQSGLTIDDRLMIVNPLVQESNASR